jgi:MFS transporter, ACS family, allantoate permease
MMAASTLPPIAGLMGMALLPNTPHFRWIKCVMIPPYALYVLICVRWGMYLITVAYPVAIFLPWTLSKYHSGFTSFAAESLTIVPSNVAGRTKKTIISSGTFLGYCVGNMCGSQIFKTKDAPRYIPGTIGCAVCLGAEFVLIVVWRAYYVWQNKRRDMQALASDLSTEEQERLGRQLGEMDVTDMKNPYFRLVISALLDAAYGVFGRYTM